MTNVSKQPGVRTDVHSSFGVCRYRQAVLQALVEIDEDVGRGEVASANQLTFKNVVRLLTVARSMSG